MFFYKPRLKSAKMNNSETYSNFLAAAGVSRKLAEAANPFKGTSYDILMKAQRKVSLEQQRIMEILNGNILKNNYPNYYLMGRDASKMIPFSESTLPFFTQIAKTQKVLRQVAGNLQHIENAAWRTALGNNFYSLNRFFKEIKIYEEDVEKSDSSTKEESIVQQATSIIRIDDVIKTQRLIKSIYDDNEELFRVDPFDFEEIIAELLRKQNYKVELTKRTRDGGKDIIAIQDLNGLGVDKYLVECKRYAKHRPVGVEILRSLYYIVQTEGANKGIVFTSSSFTKDAIKMQKEKHPYTLSLQDGTDVINWVKGYIDSRIS